MFGILYFCTGKINYCGNNPMKKLIATSLTLVFSVVRES